MSETPNDSSMPPAAKLLELLSGKWISQAITTAAKLDLADHLANGPLGVALLSERTSTDKRALLSLLRALASIGIFTELDGARFANTRLSEALRSGPRSARSLALFLGDRPTWDAWGELTYAVRTGKSAFEHVHGELPYPYFAKRVEECAYYDEAFTSFSNQELEAILRAVTFPATGTLVDVGGGHGTTLCSILERNGGLKGILFDQQVVVERAGPVIESFGVSDRCTVVAGDFFESVPQGGTTYLLKHVLFNWNDERATRILRSVRAAMPATSRLFIIDPVIRRGPGQTFAKFMDLEMRVLHDGGCQRTEPEFSDLLGAGGFKLVRVVDTDAPSSVIEAMPV